MKVLIIGSGGREHALARSFAQSGNISELYVAPGNAGIALQFPCVELSCTEQIIAFCQNRQIDLVFIGPEKPISEGLSDALRAASLNVVAPSMAAARLETSKGFAKELMLCHRIPTARYYKLAKDDELNQACQELGFPLVLKADGLAAGKGVIIASNPEEASSAYLTLANNGQGVIAEEYLTGWEVSLFAITDGVSFQTTVFAQDHKQLCDHDTGPNTGGMGAYAPVPEAEPYRREIETRIVAPVLQAMRDIGCPYQGILYIGLMITKDGPKVVEFNCRWGDPEAQVVLPLLETELSEICSAIVNCKVDKLKLKFKTTTALAVVLASAGYPFEYQQGTPIHIANQVMDKVLFSGVAASEKGLVTAGGRVLCLTCLGSTLAEAREIAYQNLKLVHFEGHTYRKDIGLRTNLI